MDDERAILDAVRAALEPQGFVDATTGKLRRCGELWRSVEHSPFRDDDETEYRIARLRVASSDGRTATVDLRAVGEWRGTTEHGDPITSTAEIGDVKLVREEDGWKVVDMRVDGSSLQSAYFEASPPVTGTAGVVTASILGGRAAPDHVWLVVELRNDGDRAVGLRRAAVGSRRSVAPGWRWGVATLPLARLEPGEATRVAVAAQLETAWTEAGLRMLVETDEGAVDARQPGVRRAQRSLPLAVRVPRLAGLAQLAATAVGVGAFYRWWVAGVVLVSIAAVTLIGLGQHARRYRRHPQRPIAVSAAVSLVVGAVGAALFFGTGGLRALLGPSERDDVLARVHEDVGGKVLSAAEVERRRIGGCELHVWDVRAERGRFWVVTKPPVLYPRSEYGTADAAARSQARLLRAVGGLQVC